MHNIHNQQFSIILWYSITLPQSYSGIRILSIVFQSNHFICWKTSLFWYWGLILFFSNYNYLQLM